MVLKRLCLGNMKLPNRFVVIRGYLHAYFKDKLLPLSRSKESTICLHIIVLPEPAGIICGLSEDFLCNLTKNSDSLRADAISHRHSHTVGNECSHVFFTVRASHYQRAFVIADRHDAARIRRKRHKLLPA